MFNTPPETDRRDNLRILSQTVSRRHSAALGDSFCRRTVPIIMFSGTITFVYANPGSTNNCNRNWKMYLSTRLETYIYTDRDNVGYVNKFTVFKSGWRELGDDYWNPFPFECSVWRSSTLFPLENDLFYFVLAILIIGQYSMLLASRRYVRLDIV